MYLTEDEFRILSGIKEGLTSQKIEEKYKIRMGMNDPRIVSLAKKYGVSISNPYKKKELREKSDLSKVKVVSKEEMPYFQYVDLELADYIDINKRDILCLVEYFKNISSEAWWNTHRLLRTEDGLGTSLYIKDLKTNEIKNIRTNIDGEDYIGDEI